MKAREGPTPPLFPVGVQSLSVRDAIDEIAGRGAAEREPDFERHVEAEAER